MTKLEKVKKYLLNADAIQIAKEFGCMELARILGESSVKNRCRHGFGTVCTECKRDWLEESYDKTL